ncbi:MAG: translation initiation factor IF-3 [Flavobacteriales bacterium]|nr:translation initiation factor IF-3 [Flavobacteriales bacterium]MBK6945304.1 translation initiation factor IF-3 [Flavobacteriales bacterium]MBK7241408.1 translation initiation factor IF-3 [Flavobacteriales bacterium]MBK7298295.1 translation initiation factor IF-3 [Flavobacteriales bacterium]MBK9535140.1 translation initiation factor IF-3 [Flavobacteriales bacterium]
MAGPFKRPSGGKSRRPFRGRVVKEDPHRINSKITGVNEVRVVGEGVEQGVFPIAHALRMAEEMGLDLVEISGSADPPVCRIIEYKKFLYDLKKKQKEIKAKQATIEMKEIRFGPNTDEHDINFKLKHTRKFLEEGHKVKAFVFFRGRSIVFKERGEILLLKFAQDLEDIGIVEAMPKLEGKRMIMYLIPKKKK